MRNGQGALLITNEVAEGSEAEFEAWYLREHLFERVGISGFERGRRFRSLSGRPRVMALYELDTVDVLRSPGYNERLSDPTPRTSAIMPSFRDMCRTFMTVEATAGRLDGGVLALVDLSVLERAAALEAFGARLNALLEAPGICAAHLLAQADFAPTPSAEAKLRGGPDRTMPLALVIEATDEAALQSVLRDVEQMVPTGTVLDSCVYQFLCAYRK